MNFINLLLLFFILSLTSQLFANDRKFTYLYQSTVMGKGEKEIEIWTTTRIGKNTGYFARIDNRVEFELGVTKKLQTAFYINFSNTTTDNSSGTNKTEFKFRGISSEWKYQFTSPVSDALGFALYTELGLNTDEVELESKLILDKKINKTTLALNITFEPEWKLSSGKTETETKLEGSFGLSYPLAQNIHAGFELRQHNVFTSAGLEHSAFFGGPVISYSGDEWWATLTLMPQIAGFKGKSTGSKLNLNEYEKFQARFMFAFNL